MAILKIEINMAVKVIEWPAGVKIKLITIFI